MHDLPPFPHTFFATLIRGLLDECYCFISTLVRYRIPPGIFDARSWLRMTLYHAVAWLLLGLPLTGMLFFVMRLADVVAALPGFREETPRFAAGRPLWAWPGLHPLAAWWLETLLLAGLLGWALAPEGRPGFHALFGASDFFLYVFALGFAWRFMVERLGAMAISRPRR